MRTLANRADGFFQQLNDPYSDLNKFPRAFFGLPSEKEEADQLSLLEAAARAATTQAKRFSTGLAFGGLPGANPTTALSAVSDGAQAVSGRAPGEINRAVSESGLPSGVKAIAAPAAMSLDAFEGAQRGINTAIAGSVLNAPLTVFAGERSPNPLYRDGFETQDVLDTYARVWNDEVTPGQAIALTTGRHVLNAVDLVVPGDMQSRIDAKVIEHSKDYIENPANTRGLTSWMTGLHSDFDIYDSRQNDSAFNQGVGRWITGATDAAILWWAAPDIIAAKGAGWAGRQLFTRAIDDLGDLDSAGKNLAAHGAWRAGQKTATYVDSKGVEQVVNAKATDVGRLVDSTLKLNKEQMYRHALAQDSSDASLVANIFGGIKDDNYYEAGLALRGMMGDVRAVEELLNNGRDVSKAAADSLRLNMEAQERIRKDLAQLGDFSDNFGGTFMGRSIGDVIDRKKDDLDEVLQEAFETNDALAQLDAMVRGFGRSSGLPDTVRFGKIRLSKFQSGPNSPWRMKFKAKKQAERAAGRYLWQSQVFKSGGKFGRTIRYIHSGGNYLRTMRMNGHVDLSTSADDLVDEMDSAFGTLPMMRRLARLNPESAYMPSSRDRVGVEGAADPITADAFRSYWINEALNARSASERFVVLQKFEQQLIKELQIEYGLSKKQVEEMVSKYKGFKEGIENQLKERGFFSNDEEIVVIPELQSILAESTSTTDFNFLETIMRLDGAQGATGGSRSFKRVSLSADRGAIATFDAIWRPLVLMRLGYTQRNVAEGWLRELAAFGTVGYFKDRAFGTTAADIRGPAAAAYRARQLTDAVVRPFRFYNRRQIRNELTALRAKQGQIDEERAALKTDEDELEGVEKTVRKKEEKAEKAARKGLTEEAKDRQATAAGAVWEEVETLKAGLATEELLDTADEIVVPVTSLNPLFNVNSRRRAKVASGFENEEAARLQSANETDEFVNPNAWLGDGEDPTNAQVKEHLTFDQRDEYDRVKFGQTPEDLERYYELQMIAQQAAVRKAVRQGHYVTRRKGNGTYEVVRSPSEVTMGDVLENNLALLHKDKLPTVTHVRASVYGETVDLRSKNIELPSRDDPAFDTFPRTSEYDGETGLEPIRIQDKLGDRKPPEITRLRAEAEALFEFDQGSFHDESQFLDELEDLLEIAESDPLIADALRLRALATRLPPSLRQWMIDNDVLITAKTLKKLIKDKKRSSARVKERQQEYVAARSALKEKFEDPEYVASMPELEFLGDDVTFHGGARVSGDQISPDPAMTETNVNNLHGVGFYTSRDPEVVGSYLTVKAVALDDVDNPVFYAVEPSDVPESQFFDLDTPMENVADMDPQELQEIEEGFIELVEDVLLQVDEDIDIADAYERIEEIVMETTQDQFSPFVGSPRTDPINLADYKNALEEYLLNLRGIDRTQDTEAVYDVQMLFVNALRDRGFKGMRHIGGRRMGDRDHEVFIWLDPPNMVRVDQLSDEALRVSALMRRHKKAITEMREIDDVRRPLEKFTPYEPSVLDASQMGGWRQNVMGRLMVENGIGRVLVDDTSAPNGYRIMVRPDMMSVGVDSIDAVPPGSLAGNDYADNLIPQLERQAATSNPAVFTPNGYSDEELLVQLGSQDAVNFVRGKSRGTPESRAAVVRWMETRDPDGGYTHIQIGDADSNTFVSASEILGKKKTGLAYGQMLDADEVSQTKAMILRSDDEFTQLDQQRQQLQQQIAGKEASLLTREQEGKAIIDNLTKRLKRQSKKGSQSNTMGTGQETIVSRFGEDIVMDGPLGENNQGAMYADLSGSERRNNLELFGFSDKSVRKLRKTYQVNDYTPGSELYFERLAEQFNRFYRNDPVAMALLSNPELALDDNAFAEWLPGFLDDLTQTKRGRAWLRDIGGVDEFDGIIPREILRDDAFDDAYARITEIRDTLNTIIPVKGRSGESYSQVWRDIADASVNPQWLRSQVGWRSDLGAFTDYAYVLDQQNFARRNTAKIMRTLGTLPENHLVRHPFFRARWREEMKRQVDLYGEQFAARGDWDGSFTSEQINAMNNVSRRWALKQTNETLYTINRISTPAHMMRFVAPFFPAWASTMRFWLLRMPVEKPENVIRYSYLFNAPEAIGAVQDREGNQVERSGNFMQRIGSKFTGVDENQIVIQMTPRAVKTFQSMTGGNGTLRISKGSLDMMLQGEHFWLPGLGPLLQIPTSVIAGMKPDYAEAIRTGNVTNGAQPEVDAFFKNSGILEGMTRAAYESVLPFGPSREKNFADISREAIAPAWFNKAGQAAGIWGDTPQFSNSAVSMYRDRIVEWELGDRTGPTPQFEDSVRDARIFFGWRAAMNLTLPFAPGFASENEFYAQEWRRIERSVFDNGGTYQEAQDQFIGAYGTEYFAFTQSLSAGTSGMSSTVGEFQEFESNPELYGDLANIGEDASFITMGSRPFDKSYSEDGFDPAIYAWQFNRQIEGAPGKFFRAGSTQRKDMLIDVNTEVGWYEYNKAMDVLTPLFESGEISEEVYKATKDQAVDYIGSRYTDWFESYKDIGGNRSYQSARAMDLIVNNDAWMSRHGDTGYAQGMVFFNEGRRQLIAVLDERANAGLSSNIDAKANLDVALTYEQLKMQAAGLDTTGELARMIDRFFGSDRLEARPGRST